MELGPYDLLSIALELLSKEKDKNSLPFLDDYLALLDKYPKQKL